MDYEAWPDDRLWQAVLDAGRELLAWIESQEPRSKNDG